MVSKIEYIPHKEGGETYMGRNKKPDKAVSFSVVIDNDTIKRYHIYDAKVNPKNAYVYRKAKNTASEQKLFILRPLPHSLNQWMTLKSNLMNLLAIRWHNFIIWYITYEHPEMKDIRLTNAHIGFFFVKTTLHRWDIDNLCEKHIMDGLVQSGVLIDDDYLNVKSVCKSGIVDKSSAGVKRGEYMEIWIEGELSRK